MADKNYLEIPLAQLSSNPRNPRKSFVGRAFDELVASIKEKGVIEPIIVRPRKAGGYEVVAGERRLRASLQIGLPTIPAVVRELTDDQAFDFMLIENLQREDLTEFEEAQSFQLYVGRHGDKAAMELSGRTGISPRYIRRRMAVLHLPEYALEAWRKGKLKYGHLEQLLRVRDNSAFKHFFQLAIRGGWHDGMTPIEELKRRIDEEAPELGLAYFPLALCVTCPRNSNVQRDLFGIEGPKGGRCLDPVCFKKRQNDWLLAHWKESPPGKKCGTNGFRFRDKVGYNDHETVSHHFPPDEKCKACPHFLTVIDTTGEPDRGDEQECFDKTCLRSRTSKMRGEATAKEKKERKPGEPRVSWHGEYFRDVFLAKRLPELLEDQRRATFEMTTLLLIAALHGNRQARETIGKRLKIRDAGWGEEDLRLNARILELPYAEIEVLIPQTIKAIVMEGQHVGNYSGFGTTNRFSVARFLGVDLGKEWAVTEDYLQKKTKAEILGLGVKLKIFADPKAKAYLTKKLKGRDIEKLKKGELVDLVLKSGVELTGKVPAEILKEGR